jgi:hypothetical protein
MSHVQSWRSSLIALGLCVGMGLVLTTKVDAVPAFARQTGLNCNQCHTSTYPVPGFTYTGKMFRLRGYRTPNIGERMQVNPGQFGGLDLSVADYTSYFFRIAPYSQTKPAGVAQEWTRTYPLYQTMSFFFVGPVAPNIGTWLEVYFQNAQTGRQQTIEQSFANVNELELVWSKDIGDNIVGVQLTNRGGADGTAPFWWPFLGQRYWDHDVGVGPSPGQLGAYTYLNRLVYAYAGVSPGGDNRDWDGKNLFTNLAFSPLHTDLNELWLNLEFNTGEDMVPLVNSRQRNGGTPFAYTYAFGLPVQGIDAKTTDNFKRLHTELRYNTVDRGPHTIETAVMWSTSKDTYTDGTEAKVNAMGAWLRYEHNRKWGVSGTVTKPVNYTYTDATGEHEIDTAKSWSVHMWIKPYMNFQPGIQISNGIGTRSLTAKQFGNGTTISLIIPVLY